ncbi:hypothetical protein DFJ63DRAFT_311837 [Scheffersomyces coipomensis]|uniref:uncharacterized protein n=1 Tax=Scheffersomyces coipomensis TaxID=1788519 RepID=UPI00315D7A9F
MQPQSNELVGNSNISRITLLSRLKESIVCVFFEINQTEFDSENQLPIHRYSLRYKSLCYILILSGSAILAIFYQITGFGLMLLLVCITRYHTAVYAMSVHDISRYIRFGH